MIGEVYHEVPFMLHCNQENGTLETTIAFLTSVAHKGGFLIQFRKRLERKNHTLAGRSARRRIKYGYHSVPKGTYIRTG